MSRLGVAELFERIKNYTSLSKCQRKYIKPALVNAATVKKVTQTFIRLVFDGTHSQILVFTGLQDNKNMFMLKDILSQSATFWMRFLEQAIDYDILSNFSVFYSDVILTVCLSNAWF